MCVFDCRKGTMDNMNGNNPNDESNGQTYLVECTECKAAFQLSGNVCKKQATFVEEVVTILYYDCPHCGHRHYAQVDNEQSLEMFEEVRRQFVQFAKERSKGQAISKKRLAKFERNRRNLSVFRNNLTIQYTEAVVYNENIGHYEEMRFVQ